jgi:hypothetical protein
MVVGFVSLSPSLFCHVGAAALGGVDGREGANDGGGTGNSIGCIFGREERDKWDIHIFFPDLLMNNSPKT